MNIIPNPSPNFDNRDGHAVDMIVLHYTGMQSAAQALERMCDPAAKVSAHYMIDEDGTVYSLIHEKNRAWHAGVSYWRGHTNINQRSIGIELVNPGHEFGYRAFPMPQMQALAELCFDMTIRRAIVPRNIVAHSDVAPLRKEDPGELFDWKWLSEQGLGYWPQAGKNMATADALAKYGYDTTNLSKAITAFQRHFRPKLLNGKWDNECATLLAALLEMV